MSTIKSTREIDSVFRSASRFTHPLLIALVANTPEGRGLEGRVAFVAGKKLGNAVARNRAKRVLREGARRAHAPWAARDVVLIARQGTGAASMAALDSAFEAVLRKAGIRP